jgi:uncharacterized protein YuzE
MRRDRVTEPAAEQILSDPDYVIPDPIPGRQNAWKRLGRSWVVVTFLFEQGDIVVSAAGDADLREPEMKITYDPEADAMYIELRYVQAADAIDIEPGVTADLDGDGHIIGFEILDARLRLGYDPLTKVVVERLEGDPEPAEA